jgi:[protein-PII] uridylyltransferase
VSELVALPPPEPEVVHQTLARRNAEVEESVRRAYTAHLAPGRESGLALCAVGGFGRKELFPQSDVDLLLLVNSNSQVPPREAIAAFLQNLWDSGYRPSHSVHTVEECVTEHDDNAELTVSLLDRRLLAGDEVVYKALDDRFRAFASKKAGSLAQQLAGLAEGRRAKYQKTIYHLEPNIKDSPGGLRDLQTTRWLLMLHAHEGSPDLSAAFDFLAGLRIRLHELAARDQNALSFAVQEALSEHPADLMRDYYRHARLVDRAARQAIESATEKPDSLLSRFYEWRARLSTNEFSVSRERVLLRAHKPPEGLKLFEFLARHGLRLAPDTLDRLHGFVPKADWAEWKQLLSLPQAAAGLRAMQEAGVLSTALPEWANIECLVVRDFYHRYTVDEHTLVAITAVETVSDGRFKELFDEVEDPALVRFALLMHDTGKGSGRDHTEVSLENTRAVMERLGAPEADRKTVEFLVQHHLDLSAVMSSRDVHDATTARTLADTVGTIERLKMLTMLTYGDISAVNPQAMTPWRAEQLWRVYLLAYHELTKELETERIHLDTAGAAPGVTSERARFLEGLPTRYLRIHTEEEVAAHFSLAQQLESRPVAVEVKIERGFYVLTLLTHDRPALFASVAGAIASFGLNILKAEAFSNAQGIIVDTFTFSDPHRTLELNPSEVDRLRSVVRRVVEGKQNVDKLLRGRPKPLRSSRLQVKPRVSCKNDASDVATLIEIVAEDRPGLLYDLANAISQAGCNIEIVMIDTEAHKALDVFYVTAQGRKLDGDQQVRLRAELLAACAAVR